MMKATLQYGSLLLSLTLAFCLTGCDRQGTVLKKNATPNPLIAKKVTPVAAGSLNKLTLLRKSAQLRVAEMAKTFGGFRYKARSSYRLKRGSRVLSLREDYRLEQSASGPFKASITNEHKKGYSVLWDGKGLYWKGLHRPFRKISEDATKASRWQQRGYGRWRAIVGIFGPRLAITKSGQSTQAGKSCVEYRVRLNDAAQKGSVTATGSVWRGPLPELTRGKAANLNRTPTAASGSFCVSSQGFVVRVAFAGSYTIGKSGAQMTLTLKAGIEEYSSLSISTPAKLATIQREPVPLDPFAAQKNRPFYLQPPPKEGSTKKKRRK